MIEFRNNHEAQRCLSLMKNISFHGKKLKLEFSSYHSKIIKEKILNSIKAQLYNFYWVTPFYL